jgi:hypothetical protein
MVSFANVFKLNYRYFDDMRFKKSNVIMAVAVWWWAQMSHSAFH